MIHLFKKGLEQILKDIDSGSCNMSESDISEALDLFNRINARSHLMTKYEACELLNISRSTFDRRVSDGTYPKGVSKQGSKELFWRECDLVKK